jgi:hypothetical protein
MLACLESTEVVIQVDPTFLLIVDDNDINSIQAGNQLFVVTERVRPLKQVLSQLRSKQSQSLSWGIYSIVVCFK